MLTTEQRLFEAAKSHSPLALIAAPGSEELCKKIDYYLVKWYNESNEDKKETFMVTVSCPRFSSGDGKGVIKESIRGMDVFIVIYVG
ncbi:MAG: ribose-phosphate pyrophosphokinase-like domain-containing protein, partial [Clostridia bacterium]|nr:ribose-phosphate pyrophosphokinase-like domain-containing protein [Clostridia bacterium]